MIYIIKYWLNDDICIILVSQDIWKIWNRHGNEKRHIYNTGMRRTVQPLPIRPRHAAGIASGKRTVDAWKTYRAAPFHAKSVHIYRRFDTWKRLYDTTWYGKSVHTWPAGQGTYSTHGRKRKYNRLPVNTYWKHKSHHRYSYDGDGRVCNQQIVFFLSLEEQRTIIAQPDVHASAGNRKFAIQDVFPGI